MRSCSARLEPSAERPELSRTERREADSNASPRRVHREVLVQDGIVRTSICKRNSPFDHFNEKSNFHLVNCFDLFNHMHHHDLFQHTQLLHTNIKLALSLRAGLTFQTIMTVSAAHSLQHASTQTGSVPFLPHQSCWIKSHPPLFPPWRNNTLPERDQMNRLVEHIQQVKVKGQTRLTVD